MLRLANPCRHRHQRGEGGRRWRADRRAGLAARGGAYKVFLVQNPPLPRDVAMHCS